MLLPDWSALENIIKSKCQGESSEHHVVKMTLEFFRDSVRAEIAQRASEIKGEKIEKEQIFIHPYAWLFVQTNSNTEKFPKRVIHEYPPGARALARETRGLRITPPEPHLAEFTAPCDELKYIFESKDISGTFYAPYSNVAVNSFSIVYRNFARSESFRKVIRDESAAGEQIVRATSRSAGAGINIGGHFGGRATGAISDQVAKDTRTRTVSGNLIADAAADFAASILMERWIEFPDSITTDRVAAELAKFILSNSIPMEAQLKRIDANNWALIAGTESRTLTREQLKQIVESSSKLNIEFSEKATIKCPKEATSYCSGVEGDVDKQFKGTDDNGIKWTKEGEQWVPTSVRLHAVSTERVTQAASASIIDVQVKRGGLLETQLQPVIKEQTQSTDLVDIIDSRIMNNFELVTRHGSPMAPPGASTAKCEKGEKLIAGSCIGQLNPDLGGGGQPAVGPFFWKAGGGHAALSADPIAEVECRGAGNAATAFAICMRLKK
jgi:hypothetical protein